jgi:hypothetical protein
LQPNPAGSLAMTKQSPRRFLGIFCDFVHGVSREAEPMLKTFSATPTLEPSRQPRSGQRHHQPREKHATLLNHNWLTTAEAATRLRQSEVTLRRRLARHAQVASDGIVARVDGIVARKSGSRWLIWLGSAWILEGPPAPCGPPATDYAHSPAESARPGSWRHDHDSAI